MLVVSKIMLEIDPRLMLAIAARLYAEIAVNFAVSNLSQEDYIRRAEEAQNRSEVAFMAYEEHVDLHRCWDANSAGQNITMGVGGSDK
jgi:hypothetical protein